MNEITIRYYKKKINAFNEVVKTFCQEEEIPCNINNALHYKAGIGIGKFWRHLYAAPKLYLANSQAFLNYRETLDPDFRDDVINTEEIFALQQEVVKNKKLQKELQQMMKNDFINYYIEC